MGSFNFVHAKSLPEGLPGVNKANWGDFLLGLLNVSQNFHLHLLMLLINFLVEVNKSNINDKGRGTVGILVLGVDQGNPRLPRIVVGQGGCRIVVDDV